MKNNIDFNSLLKQCVNAVCLIDLDDNCQILSGVLSDGLFLLCYGSKSNDFDSINRGNFIVDYHLDTAEKYLLNFKWGHGVTGLAWMLSLSVNMNLIDKKVLNNIKTIDHFIGKSLISDFNYNSYDLTVGAFGKAHYFLERNISGVSIYLEKIVDFLDNTAQYYSENEIFWFDYYTEGEHGKLKINMGLLHGHGSIIYFLSKFLKSGILKSRTHKLLNGALNFLKLIYNLYNGLIPNSLYYDKKAKSFFTDKHEISVQGWCHGVISNSFGFYFGGCVLEDEMWIKLFKKNITLLTSFRCENIDCNR
ncbi:glycoside hydrolase family protein [Litoribacter populi]|uniref:hypothetical protein n=1 Tax=Litoribacter populi TaxID=2598460 RepID=UPI00117E15D2|nr:hypothetical protein [Litoribacter populi]